MGFWKKDKKEEKPEPHSHGHDHAHDHGHAHPHHHSGVECQEKPLSAPNGAAQVKNIIMVGSGKGGVGKSTSAVNLAFALKSQGLKVGLLDADIYGPSIEIMTKAPNPTRMLDKLIFTPEQHGVSIISVSMFRGTSPQIMRGPMASNLVKQFITAVAWGALDVLIIDLPPGTGDIPLSLAQTLPIRGVILVTTPQEVSLIDVRKAAAMFATVKIPILGIVETMSGFHCECGRDHAIFGKKGGERLAEELAVPLLAEIPMEVEVRESGDSGLPLVLARPELPSGEAYLKLGLRVQKSLSGPGTYAAKIPPLGEFTLNWGEG